jgi:hypothetical protein
MHHRGQEVNAMQSVFEPVIPTVIVNTIKPEIITTTPPTTTIKHFIPKQVRVG